MTIIDVNDFSGEVQCSYKGEAYSVRDNGAVLRHPHEDKRPRPTDNRWTFGRPNEKTGYMEIGATRVHIIVATAFHKAMDTKIYVVDHIDTNRQNNRPENLRWCTRLENALNNPITRRRIELVCGSVEAFLNNPSLLRENVSTDPNFKWMRTVSPEESQICKERLLAWAESDKVPSGKGSLGDWVFKGRHTAPIFSAPSKTVESPQVVTAKTSGAAQRNWRTPSEFPCCPQEAGNNPIASYVDQLKEGATFVRNHIYESVILRFAVSNDGQSIFVITENSGKADTIKPWALARITYEHGLYIHTNLGNFFSSEGAEKQFALIQGLEWTGGDSIDDYC
ncbi:MAG: HNH endonuclease [Alphaproteobacteria bacterium]|nr:HNH endonuclease [Alphaproteobacteria bacterium]